MSRPTLSQVLAELKLEYLKKFPLKLAELKKITADRNFAVLAEEFHKLKGTGKTYGFPEISIFCEHLEFLALAKAHQTSDHEQQPEALYEQALEVLLQIHQHYMAGRDFDLQQDAIAKSILAVKAK